MSGRHVIIPVCDLAADGRGLGFMPAEDPEQGKIALIQGALPGQLVECRVVNHKGGIIQCDLIYIHSSSWTPAAPLCPHSQECGGCPLISAPYDLQLQWKQKIARDAITRIGRIDREEFDNLATTIVPSPHITAYRNKAVFAFGRSQSGEFLAGFRKPFSHEVCNINECALLDAAACQILAIFRQLASLANLEPYAPHTGGFLRFLSLRKGVHGKDARWWVICVTSAGARHERDQVARLGRQLMERMPEVACFIHEERRKRDLQPFGEKRVFCLQAPGVDATLEMELANRRFKIDAASFFQINNGAATRLADIITRMGANIPAKSVLLDLYCGAGAPGQLLAHASSKLYGIEIDRRAVGLAKKNALNAGLGNCAYFCGDAGKTLMTMQTRLQNKSMTLLVDPPRSGMDKATLDAAMKLYPENVIYVSCNPATLARDAISLQKKYRLVEFHSVGMFPHTPHQECCTWWTRL